MWAWARRQGGATTAEYALLYSDNPRSIDDLGRVVLPAKLRRQLDLEPGDAVQCVLVPHGILLLPVKQWDKAQH